MSSDFRIIMDKSLYDPREVSLISNPKERKQATSLKSQINEWVFIKDDTSKTRKLIDKIKIKTGLTPHIQKNTFASSRVESPPRVRQYYKNGITINRLAMQSEPSTKASESPSEETPKPPILNRTIGFSASNTGFLLIQKSTIMTLESELKRKKKINDSYCLDTETLDKAKKSPRKTIPVPKEPVKKKSPLVQYPPLVLRKPAARKIDAISIREAMRDREWLNSAKDQILKDIVATLNRSNGLQLLKPEENYFAYKYFLGGGNNSTLIRQIMATRPWWTRVNRDEISKAHLVWTQWRDTEYLASLPGCNSNPTIESTVKSPLICAARYELLVNYNMHPGRLVDMTPLGFDELFLVDSFCSVNAFPPVQCADIRLHNRLEGNAHLANKKGLYHNLRRYFSALGKPQEMMPLTFHVQEEDDQVFGQFESYFALNERTGNANLWILKPGENSNRGNGISICTNLQQIKGEVKQLAGSKRHTAIIQEYIPNPFLVFKRKFDIRCFALVTCFNGVTQAYFYSEGYLRTTSSLYSTSNTGNKFAHLTNDAVQQKSQEYGKYENGNKMSFSDFQKYLDSNYEDKTVNFCKEIVPQLKEMVKETVMATFLKLSPNNRMHTFEILGYDFLLDSNLKPWLLEVNTNPCLELSSPQLARIIPAMLQNAFRIAIDPVFQEPSGIRRNSCGLITDPLIENKFILIFHSLVEGEALKLELNQLGTLGLLTEIDPAIDHFEEDVYNVFVEEAVAQPAVDTEEDEEGEG